MTEAEKLKLLISRWLIVKPRVLIFTNPTLRLDIFAKEEIYQLFNILTEEGIALLLISSDLDELIKLSNRILYIKKGCIQGEFKRKDHESIDALKTEILNLFLAK